LLDATGRAISETGDPLAKLPEPQRLGLVIFMVPFADTDRNFGWPTQ